MNLHEKYAEREIVKGSSERSFGIVFTIVFLVIGLWPLPSGNGVNLWALIVAAVILALALTAPRFLAPFNRLWTRFGLFLHPITSAIIMGLIFYVAVTPTALIFRILGKDPMRRRLDPEAATYWIDREPPGPAPETMKHQF